MNGVIVAQVMPDSPAADAGLRGIDRQRGLLGDVITKVDGEPVHSISELTKALGETGIGNTAVLTVVREGEQRRVELAVTDISEKS